MSEILTAEGYEQTKEKLRDLETRLAEMEKRTDLDPEHRASVRRSYKMMMREFLQDIKLYEAGQAKRSPVARPDAAAADARADRGSDGACVALGG